MHYLIDFIRDDKFYEGIQRLLLFYLLLKLKFLSFNKIEFKLFFGTHSTIYDIKLLLKPIYLLNILLFDEVLFIGCLASYIS